MNGFVSYSHDDHKHFEELATHLAAIKRAYPVALWTDHEIHTGSVWEQRIADAITAAEIFVLLVSNNFINSDYVWNTELPADEHAQRRCQGCTWEAHEAAIKLHRVLT